MSAFWKQFVFGVFHSYILNNIASVFSLKASDVFSYIFFYLLPFLKGEKNREQSAVQLVSSFSVFSMRICLIDRKEVCWVWCMVFLSTLFHSWIYSWCCKVLVWSVGGRCVCALVLQGKKSVKGVRGKPFAQHQNKQAFCS